jgi:hypothetical protein
MGISTAAGECEKGIIPIPHECRMREQVIKGLSHENSQCMRQAARWINLEKLLIHLRVMIQARNYYLVDLRRRSLMNICHRW